jgi:hypothetical protein
VQSAIKDGLPIIHAFPEVFIRFENRFSDVVLLLDMMYSDESQTLGPTGLM